MKRKQEKERYDRLSFIRPGQIVVQAIDLNEPPGKPIKNACLRVLS